MSASYVALAVLLPDLEDLVPVLDSELQSGRKKRFLAYIDEQFDSEYEEDMELEDISFEGGRLIVEFLSSTELCNEITHALFEGLAEKDGRHMLALEYNTRIGVYTCMMPGYDEAEYIDDCFDDFDALMHELEDFTDRRDQLLRVIELTETEPVKSRVRELFDDDDFEQEEERQEEENESGETDAEEAFDEERDQESLMQELKQAMADGDEERAQELFAMVQQQS